MVYCTEMMTKSELGKVEVLEQTKLTILEWYELVSGGKCPREQHENTDCYGTYTWHLEPQIPDVVNPGILAKTRGDSWSLDIVPLPPPRIISFIP